MLSDEKKKKKGGACRLSPTSQANFRLFDEPYTNTDTNDDNDGLDEQGKGIGRIGARYD